MNKFNIMVSVCLVIIIILLIMIVYFIWSAYKRDEEKRSKSIDVISNITDKL